MDQIEPAEKKWTHWIKLWAKQRMKCLYRVEIWMLFCQRIDHVFSHPIVLKRRFSFVSCIACVVQICLSVCSTFSCLLWVTFQLYIWEHAEFCKGCHSKVCRHVSLRRPLSVCFSIFSFLFQSAICVCWTSFALIFLSFLSLCHSLYISLITYRY